MSNVRNYTDKQLLQRVETIGGKIPNYGKYHIIGVQSNEDAFNLFDDKFYVFDGPGFRQVSSGTTNAGKTALQYFEDYNLTGAAVWKTNCWYEDLYMPGYHKTRMKALRQVKPALFFRDSNKDNKIDETGKTQFDIIYANMHGVSYDPYSELIKENINGWSFACNVWNRMSDYRDMIRATWERNKPINYTILKEF
jgi:hypothetical protein